MTDYAYHPERPYQVFLLAGAPPTAPSPRSEQLVGTPSPSAPPEVRRERHDWHTGIEGTDFSFHWGSAQCLIERGKFAEPFDADRIACLSRAERVAVERYDQARAAFRVGRYSESLAHVVAGLRGSEGRLGNPQDYRLLFLLGLIHLGSFENTASELLDLGSAETAFATAARHAAVVQPADAAWAFAAAGWAAYCRGEWQAAVGHARQGLLLRSRFAEAEYVVAKSLARLRRPELARVALAAAFAVHPSFASRALSDPDFGPYGADVEALIQAERVRVGQRAESAMKTVIERAVQLGVLDPHEQRAVDLPTASGTAWASKLLDSARSLMEQNTLYGFFEAEALAGRTIDALAALVTRSDVEKRALEGAVRTAHETIGKLSGFGWKTPRSNREAAAELAKAAELLATTAPATGTASLRQFLQHHAQAKAALAAAGEILAGCQRSALDEAGAQRERLTAEINGATTADESWARCIRRGACFGMIAAGMVTMYTEILTGGKSIGNGDLRTLSRLALLGVALTLVGAILGAITAPIANSSALSQREKAESARNEIEATIRRLMEMPLGDRSRTQ